jgi:hypothetical protein
MFKVKRLQGELVEGTELKIYGRASKDKEDANEILDPGGIEMPELAGWSLGTKLEGGRE